MWGQAAQQANTAAGDLRMEDFPAAGQAPGAAQGSGQAAGSGRWAGAISAAGGQGGLRAEDFPALPGKGYPQAIAAGVGVLGDPACICRVVGSIVLDCAVLASCRAD